jgi:FAD/FMN-containing dehydrogenase/Fe-S oxidoreductase
MPILGDPDLARTLRREVEGDVLFDPFSRGRYSTDASIYQIEPIGVVVPKNRADVRRAVQVAADAGVPVLPRGGGTSQCGQTVGEALVVDTSRHLDAIIDFDAEARSATVEPGVVLDHLNGFLRPHGLFYPVDVSTGSRATIGGMAGNNSCGARSIRYGNMIHNVTAIDAVLADGSEARFGPVPANLDGIAGPQRLIDLVQRLRALAAREKDEIRQRFPDLLRRVGGYNIDGISERGHNMADMLVGSEGTLGFFTGIELALQPLPAHRVLGVCHFPTFRAAMEATPRIVTLGPSAVELVDSTMIDLARDIPAYGSIIDRFVVGRPAALLLVEFAGDDAPAQHRGLARLVEMMGDLGHPGAVLEATDDRFQRDVWEVRKAGLNIMMSMKGDGKPVSFIEDCAVRLDDLADYTERLTDVFDRHGVVGTWYAHASVGCLHVRPVLNMKDGGDVGKMRTIAEEAFAMVREYKGSHSGEHGDGLVRSEFHEPMFGSRLTRAFEAVKDAFDPAGLFNPGKIVRPSRMDDRGLFRYRPGYGPAGKLDEALDWSDWGGFLPAVEMCNNNGACRKSDPGVMCPSYRATGEERHLTRGRANTLRLALTGQLGAEALTSGAMAETMDLCVGCKGCKRECPTGVDMARMKIEYLHQHRRRNGLGLRDRLIAYLPRYAPTAVRWRGILNLRDQVPGLAAAGEWLFGLAGRRPLPRWRGDVFTGSGLSDPAEADVVLLPDTFNTYFEPDNLRAAQAVFEAAGKRVAVASLPGERPLCCGRTFLAAGLVEEARYEARRMAAALAPYVDAGVPIVGLEPSCLLSLRDEFTVMLSADESDGLAAAARLFEEYVAEEAAAGRFDVDWAPAPAGTRALVHGHCHQKAFGIMGSVEATLDLLPGIGVSVVEAGCCGMAGAFGYEAEHYEMSMRMGEMGPLPALREAPGDDFIVAAGTSCRHQIEHGAGRPAVHPAVLMRRALSD